MRKGYKALAITIVAAFCLGSASQAPAVTKRWAMKNLPNKIRGYVLPVWQIFEKGTTKSVTWTINSANPRFAVYDSGTVVDTTDDMVLDRETGLVWERSPSTSFRSWESSADWCYSLSLADRKGFRLPTQEELMSLVDMANSNPVLPTDHPFMNVQNAFYWSASSRQDPNNSWGVVFSDGDPGVWAKTDLKNVWCVRGGQGDDGW